MINLLRLIILLLPSMLTAVAAGYLCHMGHKNEWGWFLFVSLLMFFGGASAWFNSQKANE